MRRTVLFLAFALAASSTFAHDQGGDVSKVNGSIHAESGQTYGDLDTVNGSIHIDSGASVGDVETVNGSISGEDKAVMASASRARRPMGCRWVASGDCMGMRPGSGLDRPVIWKVARDFGVCV